MGVLSLREPVPISHTQRCPASLLTIALKGTSSHKVRSAMSTMKAVRAHKRGGPEVLRYEDAHVPEVGPNEVLVEVNAAAVIPGELAWDETWQSADGADRTPVIPSHEFSGVIAQVGGDVRSLTPGTQVYGLIDFNHDGAAAEYVSLPQEGVVPRPLRLSHVESAALPLAALTAWQALADRARVQPGERVFIQGGAGGVGSLAVQFAKALGAEVTATAIDDDEPLVKTLGAAGVVTRGSSSCPAVLRRASPSQTLLLLNRQSITVMLPAELNVCTPSTCGSQSGPTLPTSISSYV